MRHKRQKTTNLYPLSCGGGRSIAIVFIGAIILVGVLGKIVMFKKPTTETVTKELAAQALNGILSPEDINKLPDVIYREDIPSDIVKKLPSELINMVPSRFGSTTKK